jgi:hypothetical protein
MKPMTLAVTPDFELLSFLISIFAVYLRVTCGYSKSQNGVEEVSALHDAGDRTSRHH